MDLLESTIKEKEKFYNQAVKYFYNINPEEYGSIEINKIVSKSIAILIDHDFITTPAIQIKLELCTDEN